MTDYKNAFEMYGEIDDNHEAVCPYCFKPMSDTWALDLADCEGTTVTCGHCEKDFDVQLHISYTYTSRRIEVTDD